MTHFLAPETIEVTCPPCFHCGQSAKVKVAKDQFQAWQGGQSIQVAMPEMPTDDRELLITGTHSACWDAMFADEDEEEG